jgi:hypothetical protein
MSPSAAFYGSFLRVSPHSDRPSKGGFGSNSPVRRARSSRTLPFQSGTKAFDFDHLPDGRRPRRSPGPVRTLPCRARYERGQFVRHAKCPQWVEFTRSPSPLLAHSAIPVRQTRLETGPAGIKGSNKGEGSSV